MNWAQIKKSVNSDLNTPLNSKIDSQTTSINNNVNTKTNTVLSKFGLTLKSNNSYTATDTDTFNPPRAVTFSQWGIIIVSSQNLSSTNLTIGSNYVQDPGYITTYKVTNVIAYISSSIPTSYGIVQPNLTYYIQGSGNIRYYAFGGGAITNFLKYLLLMLSLQRREVL